MNRNTNAILVKGTRLCCSRISGHLCYSCCSISFTSGVPCCHLFLHLLHHLLLRHLQSKIGHCIHERKVTSKIQMPNCITPTTAIPRFSQASTEMVLEEGNASTILDVFFINHPVAGLNTIHQHENVNQDAQCKSQVRRESSAAGFLFTRIRDVGLPQINGGFQFWAFPCQCCTALISGCECAPPSYPLTRLSFQCLGFSGFVDGKVYPVSEPQRHDVKKREIVWCFCTFFRLIDCCCQRNKGETF